MVERQDVLTTPVLQGSRCTVCGTVGFPGGPRCGRCATRTAEPVELSREGRVWAHTVQRFPPKSPPYVPPSDGFRPFAVGYVELAEGIKVFGRIETEEFEALDSATVYLVGTDPVPTFAPTVDGGLK